MIFNNFDYELKANILHDIQYAPPQSEGYSGDLDAAYGSTSPLSLRTRTSPNYSHILQNSSRKPESCQEIFSDFSQTPDPVTKALDSNFDQGRWSEPGHLLGPPGKAPILTEKPRGLSASILMVLLKTMLNHIILLRLFKIFIQSPKTQVMLQKASLLIPEFLTSIPR
jgi:hypothetical protein